MRYRNTDVKGGLEFLDQLFGDRFLALPHLIKTAAASKTANEEGLFLDRVLPFGTNAKSLVNYITQERRISPEIAAKYLKEVHFTNRENGKKYFAAGFENLAGGYEIRNPFFKSSIGAKDISQITSDKAIGELYVFEGFIDFLSKLTLEPAGVLSADVLVLNSVSYIDKAIKLIHEMEYRRIVGFFDNDKAGEDASKKLESELGSKFFDRSSDYKGFKDLNEFLKSTA